MDLKFARSKSHESARNAHPARRLLRRAVLSAFFIVLCGCKNAEIVSFFWVRFKQHAICICFFLLRLRLLFGPITTLYVNSAGPWTQSPRARPSYLYGHGPYSRPLPL